MAAGIPVEACAAAGLIAGDEILDEQRTRIIQHPDAAPRSLRDPIPLDDIPFDDRGSGAIHFDAASIGAIQTHVVGDHIVKDFEGFRGRISPDVDSATTATTATETAVVVGNDVHLY